MVCGGHDPSVSKNRLLRDIKTGVLFMWENRSTLDLPLEEGYVIRARWTTYLRTCRAWKFRPRKYTEPLFSVAHPTGMQIGAVCELL